MDSGEEIPALNETWTMLGAKPSEWGSGLVMFMMCSELFNNVARAMPYLMAIWLATTVGMALLRKSFPDEEKGIANHFMTMLGFCPPNIPRPAPLQPIWSGAPTRTLPEGCHFARLGLAEIVNVPEEVASAEEVKD